MPKNGAFTIIVDDRDRVLLKLRDDMPMWDMIGGHVEEGETFEEAAIREAKEETGLDVKIVRRVGTYTKQRYGIVVQCFMCKTVGGKLEIQDEGILQKYFAFEALPKNMSSNQKNRIKDAFEYLEEPVDKIEGISTSSMEILKNLERHEFLDLDFWENHPNVIERKRLGTLRFYPTNAE